MNNFTPKIKEQSKQWTKTKVQSKQWTRMGESCLKKAKAVIYAGKVMNSVFWDVG